MRSVRCGQAVVSARRGRCACRGFCGDGCVRRRCPPGVRAARARCPRACRRGPLVEPDSQKRCPTPRPSLDTVSSCRRGSLVATARVPLDEGSTRPRPGASVRRAAMDCEVRYAAYRGCLALASAGYHGGDRVLRRARHAVAAWSGRGVHVADGFRDSVVLSGLTNPTVLQFASDGRIFVGQKNGVIKVFQSLTDTNPSLLPTYRAGSRTFGIAGCSAWRWRRTFPPALMCTCSMRTTRGSAVPRRPGATLARRRRARRPMAVWCRGGCRDCRSAGT